jgi:hypothetical protein
MRLVRPGPVKKASAALAAPPLKLYAPYASAGTRTGPTIFVIRRSEPVDDAMAVTSLSPSSNGCRWQDEGRLVAKTERETSVW